MKVANHQLLTVGRFVKTARLRDEWYDFVEDPLSFIEALRGSKPKVDLCTFLQEIPDREPKYPFHHELQSVPVLPITTYDHWVKKQLNDKTRNMVRKAAKSGVELRPVEFNDEFLRGVVEIFNESPLRQGRRFWHYGKDLETVRRELGTFPDRSHYVGAFHNGELIGFIKLTRNNGWACLMQIISKVAHRDKAPNNALMARAVELCVELKIPLLQYGTWSRGGLGDYKAKHGFVRFEVPRYYVPMNSLGRVALKLRLHHDARNLVPQRVLDFMVTLRGAWYSYKYSRPQIRTGQ